MKKAKATTEKIIAFAKFYLKVEVGLPEDGLLKVKNEDKSST